MDNISKVLFGIFILFVGFIFLLCIFMTTEVFGATTSPKYSTQRITQLETTVNILKQEMQVIKAQSKPDKLRNLELQLLTLRDRVERLEVTVQQNKRSDEQVLIDLIKRTNNLHEMLMTHKHR